jgi:phytoene dehydrogenase-like protein
VSTSPSAVVVGGGHNGLVAGVVLARAGLDVTVVEAGPEPGGCIWTEVRPSGHRIERGAVDHGGMAAVAGELRLADHGLTYVQRTTLGATAFGDGARFTFPVSSAEAAAGLGGDGPAYVRLVELAHDLFGMLDRLPEPPTPTALGAALASLPGGDALFRTVLSSAEAVLERTLDDEHLRSAVASHGAHGQLAPWLPGTGTLALLLPAAHDRPAVRPLGGSRALVDALVAALRAAGGALVTDSPVVGLTHDGRRAWVRLAGGDELVADRVVSNLDVVRTARLLDDPPAALLDACRQVGSGRFNVAELKVDLTFDAPIGADIAAGPAAGALWTLQRAPDSLRRAFGAIVAGRLPDDPPAMWALPSAHDPAAAPGGGAVLWLSTFVPLHPAAGPWTASAEEAAADRLLRSVGDIAGADLAARAREVVVTGPRTWAERLRSADGNPNHLDLTIDQVLGWRPPGMRGHRTPLPWLYLGGAGTHPGGGLSGVPGRAAAAAVTADLGAPARPVAGRARSAPARAAAEVASLWAGFRLYRSLRRGVTPAPLRGGPAGAR